MSQELAHDKRVQAGLSTAGAILGLSALATKGGSVAVRQTLKRAPEAARTLKMTPKVADTAEKTSIGLVTAGAGVGGAGGLKFASLQRKEAKKEERGLAKAYDPARAEDRRLQMAARRDHARALEQGRFLKVGEVRPGATQDDHDAAGAPRMQRRLAMAPKPRLAPERKKLGGINPERSRQRRLKAYEAGAAVAGGVAAGGSAVQAGRAAGAGRQMVRHGQMVQRAEHVRDQRARVAWALNGMGNKARAADVSRRALGAQKAAVRARTGQKAARSLMLRHGKSAAVAAAVAGGAVAASRGVKNFREKGQGRHYSDWWDG